jgi:hypothetical protein
MASTARDFITLAMKQAGVLGIGQTLNAEDINDGFTILNRMLGQWQKKRWLVPSLYEVVANGNSLKSNLIGPGQYYNAPRPDKIQSAYFIQKIQTGLNSVSFPLTQIWSYEDYSTITLKELNTWPQYFFYDGAFPYGNIRIWPIPSSNYEIHLVVKSPIGFTVELLSGTITISGSGYVSGSYISIPFISTSGVGYNGTADVTVAGGIVTAVVLNNPGDGYKINDFLTLDNTLMGGVGSGFSYTVTNVTSTLDAEFNMPPEYEEAIHYNLAIRLCAMYQYPVDPVTAGLAKLSLNVIKIANSQIPTLMMPTALRNNRGGSYIFSVDAR